MKVAGNLADKHLPKRCYPIEKLPVAAVQLVERPGRYANAVGQNVFDLREGDLRLGLKLDFVGYVSFFRRTGSLAQTSGRYTVLSNST